MAKLSARGHREIVRISYPWKSKEGSEVQTRTQLAIRSDGVILQKVTFRGGCFSRPEGAWKVATRFKSEIRKGGDEAIVLAAKRFAERRQGQAEIQFS